MTDSRKPADDIAFTIGSGNQSSICGGVKPLVVIDPAKPAAQPGAALPDETRPVLQPPGR